MPNIPNFAKLENLGSASCFVEDIHQLFSAHSLFQDLSRQECDVLCEYMACYGAPSNTVLLEEGHDGDFLMIVLTGSINVIKRWQNNETKFVVNAGPGEFLGEMSLIDGNTRSATCKTAEPTDFAIFTRKSLNEILIDHPRLGNKFLLMLLQLLTIRLRSTTTRMLPMLPSTLV